MNDIVSRVLPMDGSRIIAPVQADSDIEGALPDLCRVISPVSVHPDLVLCSRGEQPGDVAVAEGVSDRAPFDLQPSSVQEIHV